MGVSALKSSIFEHLDWVEHGFGTRDDIQSQDEMATLRQIHSATVLPATQTGCVGDGDGLITSTPGLAVSIRTADCFPVLMVDARNRVAAAVHAGWRGTAERILPAAIDFMRAEFDSRSADIYAAIGPGIGECCYPVGEEVSRRFGLSGAACLDLGRENRDQLIEAHVPEAHIHLMGLCTFCDAARFHSYRRDKDSAGRMISFIRIRPT